ncbi:MAG: hypothetical protein WC459_02105 [Patescibacteria group bacterium]
MKIRKILKIFILILIGAGAGIAIFSFVIAKTLWFPNTTITTGHKAGVDVWVYSYSPWLWNKKRVTKTVILDRKNDGPKFEIKTEGINSADVKVVHGGEDFAVLAVPSSEFTSSETIYILHRVPKADGEESLESTHIGGNIFAVAPDESGYFYLSQDKLFKRSWQGETMIKADLPSRLDPVGMEIFFFGGGNKLALKAAPMGERDPFVYVWDLKKNEIKVIDIYKNFSNYSSLSVGQDERLYIERTDVKVIKKLLAE